MEDTIRAILVNQTTKLEKIDDAQTEIKERLSSIETHLSGINGKCIVMEKDIKEHDEKLSSLQNWRSYVNGGLTILGFLSGSALFLFILNTVIHFFG